MWLTRLHDMAGVCNCVAALVRLFADSLVIFADQTELLTVFDLLLLGAQSSHVGSLVFVIILVASRAGFGWNICCTSRLPFINSSFLSGDLPPFGPSLSL